MILRRILVALVAFLAILALLTLLIPDAPDSAYYQDVQRPLVIALQGGDGLWPGGTMYAFENAVRIGADVLEKVAIRRSAFEPGPGSCESPGIDRRSANP